jgi:cytochrome b561
MKTAIGRHGTISMFLHWSVALLILCASLSSFFLGSAFSDDVIIAIRTFHNLTGTLALGLVIVWFGWRALHEEIPKLASIGSGEQRFMEITNGSLNGLLLLVPLTGILHLFALGKSIDLGVLKLSFAISMSQQHLEWLGLAHNVCGKLLLAVALLHSVHALWHQFGKRDGLVRRMLPWAPK